MDELCPWPDRRSPEELYLKLCIIYFTVFCGYLHLLHLRNEIWDIFSIIVVICNPLVGAVLTILPLPLMLVQLAICSGDPRLLKPSLGILIGRLPWTRQGTEPVQRESLGSVLGLLALLTQCIGSIWLFSRRLQRDADALYDHQILQLALLGSSTAFMSLIQLVFEPDFPIPAPSTWRIDWLMFFRPRIMLEFRLRSTQTNPTRFSFYKLRESRDAKQISKFVSFCSTWATAMIAMPVAKAIGLRLSPTFPATIFFLWIFGGGGAIEAFPVPYVDFFGSLAFTIACIPIANLFNIYTFGRSLQVHLFVSTKRLLRDAGQMLILSLLVIIFVPWNDIATMPLRCMQVWWKLFSSSGQLMLQRGEACPGDQRVLAGYDLIDWDHISTFGRAPTACPCPKGWKDEWSARIWNLA